MNDTLQDCADGRISPEIAVAHFIFHGAGTADIERALADAPPHPRLDALRALLPAHAARIDALSTHVAATVADHNAFGPDGIARIARFFDSAVAASPEASVALYSLGDPAILAAATAEIAEWLETEDLLDPAADVLDLGCGIGRIAAAIAPRCRTVLALDIAPGMIAEARRRHAALPNLRFEHTTGQDLAALPPAAFDLILAVDSFPYLVQAGPAVTDAHLADACRILRPGGDLVILNLSYEGDAFDDAQARAWADRFGLDLRLRDHNPFRLWDGSATILRR